MLWRRWIDDPRWSVVERSIDDEPHFLEAWAYARVMEAFRYPKIPITQL